MTPEERAAWLKAAAADKVWRDGRTTDFNRAVLDVLAERERLVGVVDAARELHRGFIAADDTQRMARLAALTVALHKLDADTPL